MIDSFLNRLDRVRETSPGQWVARCPSHGDTDPSLSIAEGDDGRVLIHCFGGCDVRSITDAVGLELKDLFPPPPESHSPSKRSKRRPDYKAMWLLVRRSFYVLVIATEDVAAGKTLPGDDLRDVRKAQERIVDVMEVLQDE